VLFAETGKYLALDLGGTNFRILVIDLQGKQVGIKNKIYPIGEGLMSGPGVEVSGGQFHPNKTATPHLVSVCLL